MKSGTISAALLLSACSGPKQDNAAEPKPVAAVTAAVVQSTTLPEVLTAYGAAEIAAGSEGTVAAAVDSSIIGIQASPGDLVRAGQALVTLKPGPVVMLDIARLGREVQTATDTYARAVRLRATGLVSDADVSTARATLATAQTTLQSTQGRLKGALPAPISGVVQSVALAPGDFATAGTPIMKIGSLSGGRIRLGIDATEAPRVRPGQRVQITPAGGGPGFSTTVISLDPRADPQTRKMSVLAAAPEGQVVGPGAALKGEITLGERIGVPTVPHAAVLFEADKPYLFVVDKGVAHRRDVLLGIQAADRVEVRQGVRPGEKVVLEGGTALSDGMAVRLASQAGPSA